MRKFTASTLLLAGATLSATALAAPYTDMYVFGDSLFDNGQFNGTRFTNRVGPDYQNSAFGPVSLSLVAQSLKVTVAEPSRVGGTNYAVGGNRSIDTLLSVTAPTTYEASAGIGNPEVDATFNSLFYDLELSGRNFDKNAIYIMDGGGNDIGATLVFDEASAGVVASNMVGAANALRARGANYVVVFNVPDFGLAPAGVPFSEFATTQVNSINSQIQAQIGSDNILIFDAASMLREIAATPSAHGLSLTTSEFSRACFDSTQGACGEAGNADARIAGGNPDPDQFFFNDGLHATTLGQQISAGYILSILQAPGELALLPEMGMDDMQSHWRSSRPVMRSNRWSKLTEVGSYTVWGGLNANEDEHDTNYSDTGTNESIQYNVGLTYRPGELWYVGAQVGRADNELEFDNSRSEYKMESLSFSVLGGYAVGNWFMEAMVSYSDLDYDDLKRSFDLGPMLRRTETGDTNGDTWGALFNVGVNVLDSSRYRLGPMVGYEWVSTDVDGYEEKSGDVTALRIDDMDTSTGIVSAGAFGDMQLEACDCRLYSEATYRYYTDDDATDPRIGLKSVAGNSAKLPGYSRDDDSWRWDIGLDAKLSDTVDLNVGGGINEASDSSGYWIGGEVSYSF